MLTKELIENRINNFLGYGNLNSDIWFIGIEEGFSCGNLEDLEDRFVNTKDKAVIDIQDDMKEVRGHYKWFLPNSGTQPTWRQLIRILLVLGSELNIDIEKIKNFQKKRFARLDSNHCSLLFMPLPCKSTAEKDWFYNKFGIDYLSSRKKYCEQITPLRISLFNTIIAKHKPKIAIFYSTSERYLRIWERIIDEEFKQLIDHLYYCRKNKTNCFIIPHPRYAMSDVKRFEISFKIKEISGIN